jgi:microcystin-dependent protein
MHTHVLNGSSANGNALVPAGSLLASTPNQLYRAASSLVAMNPAAVTNTGGSQAHQNMQPYLTLNFCIALQGIFPSPN